MLYDLAIFLVMTNITITSAYENANDCWQAKQQIELIQKYNTVQVPIRIEKLCVLTDHRSE